MTVYKIYFRDKQNAVDKVEFVIAEGIVELATSFTEHYNESNFVMMKVEYIGKVKGKIQKPTE